MVKSRTFWKFSLSAFAVNAMFTTTAAAQSSAIEPFFGKPRLVLVTKEPQLFPVVSEASAGALKPMVAVSFGPPSLMPWSSPGLPLLSEGPYRQTLAAHREQTPATNPLPKRRSHQSKGEDEAFIGIYTGELGRETLFRMETETELKERLKRENEHWRDLKIDGAKAHARTVLLPNRGWAIHGVRVEPNGVTSGRLLFEQTGPERYGQDFGPASTLISIAWFNWDLALWPVRVVTPPWQCVETSVGRALPGDPQPQGDFGFPYRTWHELP